MTLSKAKLQNATDEVKPSSFLDYRLFFANLYDFLKRESDAAGANFSWREFAELLGFKATNIMHQIVKGHRPLTLKAALPIANRLGLKGLERRYLLTLVEHAHARSSSVRDALFGKLVEMKDQSLPSDLDRDALAYFSEWYHPVIRELIGTSTFQNDIDWIAGRITPRIRPEQVKESLSLLVRLNLIAPDESGASFVQTKLRVGTGPKVRGMALTSYHQQMIDLGKSALALIPASRRDISAVTVTVNDATAARLKKMIHAFQTQLLDEAEKAGPGDQVFQINMQLFPFTE